MVPILFGREFFALTKWESFPDIADIAPSSTMVFEFSVFLTVLGGISLIMGAIMKPEAIGLDEEESHA
jgi:hypothetical protein